MPDDDFLDIFQLVSRRLDSCPELMLRLITHTGEDIGELRPPYFRVVLSATRFPQDKAFMWMFDQDTEDWQLSSLIHKRFALGAFQACVSSTDHECLVTFEPAYFKDVELGALGADIGNVIWDGATVKLSLNSGHCYDERSGSQIETTSSFGKEKLPGHAAGI